MKHGASSARRLVDELVEHRLFGIDKSERMVRLALLNLGLYGVDADNIHLANALARTGRDGKLMGSLEGRATLILTNPPFGASFEGDSISRYGFWKTSRGRSPVTLDSELMFLERYADWLAPGGQLLAIVPDSVLTNRGVFADVRAHLLHRLSIRSVISLPTATFGLAGTQTKTSILHAEKPRAKSNSSRVYFAVCKSLGFDVQTRNSLRARVPSGANELPVILDSVSWSSNPVIGTVGALTPSRIRWDASYFAHQNEKDASLGSSAIAVDQVFVSDVASLTDERENPVRRGDGDTFNYIEISDVDGATMVVRAKPIPCRDAPSRARKRVRAGDVLVSTVRPERRTVGVVPDAFDGAICSTGFAVLRPTTVRPLLLASLLRSDFVTAQLVGQVSGIAYPVIAEEALPQTVLPVSRKSLRQLESIADELSRARKRYEDTHMSFELAISEVIKADAKGARTSPTLR